MNILDNLTDQELLQTLEAECAKSLSELKCAEADVVKAKNRLRFVLSVIHQMKHNIDPKD